MGRESDVLPEGAENGAFQMQPPLRMARLAARKETEAACDAMVQDE